MIQTEIEQKHIFELWQQEQINLLSVKTEHPEWFRRDVHAESSDILSRVGIEMPEKNLPSGFLKFHPFDFIVEEILKDGSVVSSEFQEISYPQIIEKDKTVYADLVKVGISTLDAIRDLCRQFGLSEAQVGYAGIKDAIALTSQRVSFRGLSAEKLAQFQLANYFLKNVSIGKGVMEKGGLLGNRFTILVRTENLFNTGEFERRLSLVEQKGFWNFFWLQRFGNRLLGHKLGACILRGNYREAVRMYLLDLGPNDLPYYANVRKDMVKNFGNWKAMMKVVEPLPYSMRNEMLLLRHLDGNGKDYLGAIQNIPEQVSMWVQSYTSFLVNRMLSACAATGVQTPDTLPLPLSTEEDERQIYESFLEEERIPKRFEQFLKPFSRHIRLASRRIDVKIFPEIHDVKYTPEGVLLCFDLPKGTYATAFLSHLFTLISGQPVPEWVQKKLQDNKQLLGAGSTARVYEYLKPYIVEKNLEEAPE